MASIEVEFLRTQLLTRREKLQTLAASSTNGTALLPLLREVDSALERMKNGTYGICESCHEAVEADRLLADPLTSYCLDHLNPEQRRALQEDLDLAGRIQKALLPPKNLLAGGWQAHYHYEPAGPVSGDYCDLVIPDNKSDELFFALGDVSGKGVAASLLMSHLHAMFRSLTSVNMALPQLLALANRVFCESTTAGQYATLICGRAARSGDIELASAGHPSALLVRKGKVESLASTGLPLGMFSSGEYTTRKTSLAPGDHLLLFTDGISETRNKSSVEYGEHRLAQVAADRHAFAPDALTAACMADLKAYSAGVPQTDDRTLLVIHRAA